MRLRSLGIMSGTSADGVDAALVSIEGVGDDTHLEIANTARLDFDPSLRTEIHSLATAGGTAMAVARMHFRLGALFAEAALLAFRDHAADVIGSHGQTICHVQEHGNVVASLQIGAPAIIAARTGVTVVSDFRAADIAAGGQGAPLAPLLDLLLLRHATVHRVALNIGGIANITYIPPAGSGALPLAFDTGPGNGLLDGAALLLSDGERGCDRDGAWASRGHVDQRLLVELMSHPYFRRSPPKSTGKDEFGDDFAADVVMRGRAGGLEPQDILATLTEFTARTIQLGIARFRSVDEIVVSGGGARNRTLMIRLGASLPGISVISSDALGLPGQFKEAICFALLADRTIRGLPGNVSEATGAVRPTVLGSITPGSNFANLMRTVWN